MKKPYRSLQIKPECYLVGERTTPERERKLGGIEREAITSTPNGRVILMRQKAKVESTLDAYHFRRMIEDWHWAAGMIFRSAYLRAAVGLKSSDPSMPRIDCNGNFYESDTQARLTIRKAREALPEPLYAVLEAVCGWDTLAGNSRRLEQLRKGLDILVDEWGIAREQEKRPATT